MSIIVTVEIPALDRLCCWLEGQEKSELVKQIEDEIVKKLKEAAKATAPQTAQEAPVSAPAPAPSGNLPKAPEPAPAPTPPAPEPPAPNVTLDAVQKAAAELRDQGKLKAVTDLFPVYGIRKLSDLDGDAGKLNAFGAELRKMGAKL